MRITKLSVAAAIALSFALSGCAYNAPVAVSPNLNVYSSYSEKIPGRFVLVVDAEAFNTTVRPTGLACSAHHYPLDLRQQFVASVTSTLRQLVDDVQILERPLPASDLARNGFAGQVVVNAETLTARLQVVEGFFRSTADSVVELSAGMTVDTVNGRVLGTSAQGFGNAQNDAGMMCGNTATAIGGATEKAMRQLLGQLGERLSNSERLRRSAAQEPVRALAPSAAAAAAAPAAAPKVACGMVKGPNGGSKLVPC
ncbi:hypothetical protein M9M90_10890 [Phenylobacterium sp. LH3H17]|uniref:hypothetical protein n=1 Tax=Phenylobacterium sp. LH3H17 TaxID=2903901 RepID=UPI0020C9DBB6|nr:hypothetical protein [Phenylobacterium sp. LH3H17]UTP37755.1 hypothetical protein M9M90_10890 [Phenylobacterium sp. LH3H17]